MHVRHQQRDNKKKANVGEARAKDNSASKSDNKGASLQHNNAGISKSDEEWYSRPYMNILFPQTGNPFLIDKVYLGYSLDILEYRTVDTHSREHHLPKGHIWAAQLNFRNPNT